MKKYFLALVMILMSFPAIATTGAKLTTQAEHILWQVLSSEGVANEHHSEVMCLAENIYFEARAESFSGKAAVGNVTRNRVNDTRWPDTYCTVVTDGPVRESWKTKQHKDLADSERVYYPKKHRCQFSWYCDGKKDIVPSQDKDLYENILDIATRIHHGYDSFLIYDYTKGATHYHADYVDPSWAESKTKTTTIGKHIFYRWEKS